MGKKVLFIHHSTGGNLIIQGNLRDEINRLDSQVEFWDHSYNLYKFFPLLLAKFTHHKGLTNPKGQITGKDYNIVLSNNSPKEYADIFSRSANDTTLRSILNYDVIAFKNCYPTTKITSEALLSNHIKYFKTIRNSLKKYHAKQFILVTPPPLRQEATTLRNAKRAKRLVQWLTSRAFTKDTPNIHVFDLFSLLADKSGFLKKKYTRLLPFDSHPNKTANMEVGPYFARKIVEAVNRKS